MMPEDLGLLTEHKVKIYADRNITKEIENTYNEAIDRFRYPKYCLLNARAYATLCVEANVQPGTLCMLSLVGGDLELIVHKDSTQDIQLLEKTSPESFAQLFPPAT